MEIETDSIELQCNFPILERLMQRDAIVNKTEIPSSRSGVIICCRDGAWKPCDRSIIEAASKTLEGILNRTYENADDAELDVSEETLSILLDCLTGKRSIRFSHVIPLFAAACRFRIPEVADAIKECLRPRVWERFVRARGIFDEADCSDVEYLLELVPESGIELIDRAYLFRALYKWGSEDPRRDATVWETIRAISDKAMVHKALSPDCYVRAATGRVLRVSGGPSDTHVGLTDDPRVLPVDVGNDFVITGDLCVAIVDGHLEVRPLCNSVRKQRIRLPHGNLNGIDCAASSIFVWSKNCIFSVSIEDGWPIIDPVKIFRFEIARVFAFERESAPCLAVLGAGTGRLSFYDAHMYKTTTIGDCGRTIAVSTNFIVYVSRAGLEIFDSEKMETLLSFGPGTDTNTDVDAVIRGSTIYVSLAKDQETHLYRIRNGKISSAIFPGIEKFFVRVLQ